MEAELQRHQQGLALCNELTQQIRQATQLNDILYSLVSGLRRILEADRVLVYQILPDGSGKAVSEATLPYVPVLMHQTFSEEVFPRSAQHLYAAGRVRAIADVHDPGAGLAPCLVDFIAQFGVTAKLVVPIAYDVGRASRQNALWGLLVAHQCGRPRQWVDFELNLMRQLADQVSLALTHLQWAHYLDTEVEARTAELQVTNHHLHQGICEYKSREQAKNEWVSVISHELRTPLSSLHSALKILATGQLGSLSAAGQQMLSIADQSAERLMRLVTNVLDLQRFEAGKVVLNPQICAAAPLMEQAIAAMAPLAQQQQVILVSEPVDAKLWADPDALVQVLTNLLSNAIKFSPPGGTVRLTLTVKPGLSSPQEQPSTASQSAALFQVRDQGQGIPPDQLERIFEEFQQAHPHSRRKGGAGLGLSICRKIITQHHGMIWAESVWGEGSTFSFTLPVAKPDCES
ncbi:GAF domain-containing sensor histidine kinase [Leptolyngbya sp. FACHB-16]|nr:GAF domain-containing sensor histidine kinase [Leptolyngbya sp. FACHB-8]MBD2155197.1 GAF domain-containing sensor histidine kinase [Leptolyngbya sp. FACHB-16]